MVTEILMATNLAAYVLSKTFNGDKIFNGHKNSSGDKCSNGHKYSIGDKIMNLTNQNYFVKL